MCDVRLAEHAQRVVAVVVPAEGAAGGLPHARRQRAVQAARLHRQPAARLPLARAATPHAVAAQGNRMHVQHAQYDYKD